jgi:chromosome segregation ATPase
MNRDGDQAWVDIMKANLDHRHIPITVEEERPVSDTEDKQQNFYIRELQVELASLTGTLFGREGNNGRLGSIERAIEKQTVAINKLIKQYADHIKEHRDHIREIETTISAHEAAANVRFDMVEKDMNALGAKSRAQSESIDALLTGADMRSSWWKQLGTHVLKMLAAAAALAIVGGMGAWIVSML